MNKKPAATEMNYKWIFTIGIANLIGLIFMGIYLGMNSGFSGKDTFFIDLSKVYNQFTYKMEIEEFLKQENQQRRYKCDSLEVLLDQGNLNGIPPQEKVRLEQELNKSVRQYQEGMQQLTNHYDQLIWNAINKYVYEYGKSKGDHIILGSKGEGNIMYAPDNRDLTQEIIAYVNEAYKNEK